MEELMEEYPRLRIDEVMKKVPDRKWMSMMEERMEKFRVDMEKEQNDVDWTSDPHEDLQEGEDTVQRLNAVEMKQQGTNAALQAQIDTLKLRNAKLESSLAHVLACGAARPWGRCARCQLMLATMPTTNASSASDMPVTNASSASDSEVVTM
jgi:hypothetical protein